MKLPLIFLPFLPFYWHIQQHFVLNCCSLFSRVLNVAGLCEGLQRAGGKIVSEINSKTTSRGRFCCWLYFQACIHPVYECFSVTQVSRLSRCLDMPGSVIKKAIIKILTACDCNLSNCSHKETCVFFGDWLPGLSVRAITTLICISQLLLRCHPSANQCTVTVPRCLSPVEVSQLQSQKPAAKSVSTGSDNVTFDWAFLFNPLWKEIIGHMCFHILGRCGSSSVLNSFKALDFLSCLKNVYQKLVATAPLFQTFCSLTYSNAWAHPASFNIWAWGKCIFRHYTNFVQICVLYKLSL